MAGNNKDSDGHSELKETM